MIMKYETVSLQLSLLMYYSDLNASTNPISIYALHYIEPKEISCMRCTIENLHILEYIRPRVPLCRCSIVHFRYDLTYTQVITDFLMFVPR